MNMEAPREPSSDTLAPEAPSVVNTASPGSLIREARQAAGLSVDDLASLTKLARPTMEALERDDFTALLEPVYVRGYYRKCAKVLNLPEAALLEGYTQRVANKLPQAPSKLRLASGSDLGSTSSLPVPTAVLVAVMAIFACALLWFLRGAATTPNVPTPVSSSTSLSDSVVTTTQAEVSGNSDVASAPAGAAGADAALPTTPDSSPAPAEASLAAESAPAAPATTPTASPAAVSATAVAAPATAAPAAVLGEGPVLIKFKGNSWLRIKDADGKVLVRAEVPAGSQRRYGGKLPLDVFIGAAADVSLEYEGRAIDLAPHTRENKTAWLLLPAQPSN